MLRFDSESSRETCETCGGEGWLDASGPDHTVAGLSSDEVRYVWLSGQRFAEVRCDRCGGEGTCTEDNADDASAERLPMARDAASSPEGVPDRSASLARPAGSLEASS